MAEFDEETRMVDVPLTVRGGSMEDWWLIERKEHDGRTWMERSSLRCSSRISNADVEGTGEEMLALAKAIRERGEFSAKRCAAHVKGDRVELLSPRNSTYAASVPLVVADALAAEIEAVVANG